MMQAKARHLSSKTHENPQLRLIDVGKTYKSHTQTVTALGPVTMDILAREFVVLFGPSGCGKSSLLNLIAGFEAPSSGTILLDGEIVKRPGQDRLMMFQEHALFPWLNVLDNVMYGLRNQRGLSRRARREAALFYIRLVHLEQFEKASIHELSGGMKHRIALARALAPDPRILLVDEPFPALDALTREKLYIELQEIFARGHMTIVCVSHDAREAACLGDRVVIFSPRPGKILSEIKIDLPRPRDIHDPEVGRYAAEISSRMSRA
ncbi:MAG: ABC transporter ATP-binding protein [Burkholderiales bacterium]|nr:ABC transporter ATP-binding protein [Burkholderiales bacterium]